MSELKRKTTLIVSLVPHNGSWCLMLNKLRSYRGPFKKLKRIAESIRNEVPRECKNYTFLYVPVRERKA